MAESAPTPEADERACRVCAGYYSLDDSCDDDGFCHGCAHELARHAWEDMTVQAPDLVNELTRMRERCAELEAAITTAAALPDKWRRVATTFGITKEGAMELRACAKELDAALERKPDGDPL